MEALERIVFLDTETTGLDPRLGHRIIEVAAVEVIGRQVTGAAIHFFVDPERDIDAGATAVHGFTWDDLRGKPQFGAIVDSVVKFLADSRVVIHNAAFDVSFLDSEMARLRLPPMASRECSVEDSLALARKKYPGKRNSLDALCDRLGVDNSQRNLHGALLDARLLADVYLAMTRGQGSFEIQLPGTEQAYAATVDAHSYSSETTSFYSVLLSEESKEAHQKLTSILGAQSGILHNW